MSSRDPASIRDQTLWYLMVSIIISGVIECALAVLLIQNEKVSTNAILEKLEQFEKTSEERTLKSSRIETDPQFSNLIETVLKK